MNISLLPLPPRSPELNPQENIWQFMPQNWLSNRVFKSFDDILDHCCYAWRTLIDQPWKIMPIARRSNRQSVNLRIGIRVYPRVAVSHHCPVLKVNFSEFKRCEDSTSIKTMADRVPARCRSRSLRVAMLLQNSRSVPWLVLGSAARHGDREHSRPAPCAPPDRAGASGRITARQNFRTLTYYWS